MNVGFVVPRYGPQVHGGAEMAARLLAEHLVQRAGWTAEVFTTCALDSRTWANELPPGTTECNGVVVHRYRAREKNVDAFHRRSVRLFADPAAVPDAQAREWLEMQGPVSDDLRAAVRDAGNDVVTFHPYLYWPAVVGIEDLAERAVLHPATHDEAPIRFPMFRAVFERPAGLVFWTDEERELAERLFPAVALKRQTVLGIGIDAPPALDVERAREAIGIGDAPYVLCLGKVTEMKGASALSRFFSTYAQRRGAQHRLVFAGPVADAPPVGRGVVLAGPVDEEVKWGLLAGADLLVSPSAYESLSLVVLEAWAAGTPVLVNGLCGPTRRHCLRSGGGLWYEGYAGFEAALDRLLASASLRDRLARAGAAYVAAHFRWPIVLDRYTHFLARVGGSAA